MNTNTHARIGRIGRIVEEQPDDIRQLIQRNTELIMALAAHVSPGHRYMTPEQAADYIQVSKKHLMANLKDRIGYTKDNQVIRFDRADLDAFMEKNKRPAVGNTATFPTRGAAKRGRPTISTSN